MVPIQTHNGISPECLKELLEHREIYLWGTSDLSLDIYTVLSKIGIVVHGFLHNSASLSTINSVTVYPPEFALKRFATEKSVFVILASRGYLQESEALCIQSGLMRTQDYLTYRSIPRAEAMMDLVSKKSVLSIQDARLLIEKLLIDQPLLVNLTIGSFTDPLQHPLYETIIRIGSAYTQCTLSTPFCVDIEVQALLNSGLSRLDIVIIANRNRYEQRNGNGTWDILMNNLKKLIQYYHINSTVRVMLRIIRTHDADPNLIESFREIAKEGNFLISIELPYIEPYDLLLQYCEKGNSDEQFIDQKNGLTWDLDKALALSLKDRHKSCLCQRIFPIFRADKSVGICHLYQEPTICNDYLLEEWDHLIETRAHFEHCERCQKFGLHRCDLNILAGHFESFHNILI